MSRNMVSGEKGPGNPGGSPSGAPPAGLPGPRTETLIMPPVDLPIGAIISGRYEIRECLGKGGMGAVYRVLDLTSAGSP